MTAHRDLIARLAEALRRRYDLTGIVVEPLLAEARAYLAEPALESVVTWHRPEDLLPEQVALERPWRHVWVMLDDGIASQIISHRYQDAYDLGVWAWGCNQAVRLWAEMPVVPQ